MGINMEALKMGQYFVAVNLDKKEVFEPKYYKLCEIFDNVMFLRGLVYLLATPETDGTCFDELRGQLKYFGRWAGDRVMLYGDYAPEEFKKMVGEEWSILGEEYRGSEYRNITGELMSELKNVLEVCGFNRINPKGDEND